MPGERIICRNCWASIPPPTGFCVGCGRFFATEGEVSLCLSCRQKDKTIAVRRSCGRYEGVLREIILLCKYEGLKILAQDLGRLASDYLKKEASLWSGVEVVVPVPLHPRRERDRGFNQSAEIAKVIGKELGWEVAKRGLIKIKDNLPQASLEAEARLENVKGVYKLSQGDKIKGKVVLLIDDVLTTGATVEECSKILRKGGAKEVRALTIAQA